MGNELYNSVISNQSNRTLCGERGIGKSCSFFSRSHSLLITLQEFHTLSVPWILSNVTVVGFSLANTEVILGKQFKHGCDPINSFIALN